jgi:hypothetical protein
MKIAFCFSGEPRELEKSSNYWENIIDHYKADVYGSFWETNEKYSNSFVDIFSPKLVEFENFDAFKKTIDVFIAELSVPTYTTEDDNREWIRRVNWGIANEAPDYVRSANYLSMWYKIWRSNLLCSSQDYDVVVRARTDVFFGESLEIIKNDSLNIPVGIIGNSSWENCWGYVDMFAYGNQNIMNYYSSLYLYLTRYIKEGEYFFPPENLLRVHLSQRNIDIRLFLNGLFRFRDPEYCFNNAYSGFGECTKNSLDDILKPDPTFTFFKKIQ